MAFINNGMKSQLQPEFLVPFKWAVLRVATYVASQTVQPRLLFGSVSLLAPGRPRPKSGQGFDSLKVDHGRQGKIFFRRTILTAEDAVKWYRSASEAFQTPAPSDNQEIDVKLDGRPIIASNFFDDPAWPFLGVSSGSDLLSNLGGPGDPAPFVGSGSESARIHRRFGDNTRFQAVIEDPDTISFLKRRLHVDFADYTEYLGSLVLVIPNPILRRIDSFIAPGIDEKAENLVIRLIPRSGQSMEGLSLTLLERRSSLLSRFETVSVPKDGFIVLPQHLPVQSSGYVVTHPEQGVLVYQPPVPFIRSVNFSLGIVGRKVKVETPKTDSSHSTSARYVVPEISHEIPIVVGENVISDLSRVFEAEARRERRAQAKRYDQTWFDDGNRDAAIQFIRSRISRARAYVLIADPYFGARQIFQFLHAVPRVDVEFTILTSHLAFEASSAHENNPQTSDDDVSAESASFSTIDSTSLRNSITDKRCAAFSQSMATFKERGMKNASAMVLTGKKPPLHDRFLVIDGSVWFLGNSLNALGQRASLILQVPDGESVLNRLRQMRTIPFEEYVERRKNPESRRKGGS